MKKITLLLILFISIGAKVSAHDIEVANDDGVTIYYNYINDQTELSVTFRGDSYSAYSNEYSGNVVIPSSVTYDGKTYNVRSINWHAFQDCTSLTSVTIPDGVTSIGQDAFKNTGIYNNAPSGIYYVDGWACGYKGDKPSGEIVLAQNTRGIGNYLFSQCTDLISVTIPESVTSIGSSAFTGCTGLTSVTIPNSVTSIGLSAFAGCTGLTSVTIGNGVTSIGRSAFSNCSSLNKVIISDIAAWCNITFGDDSYSNPLYYAHHLYSDESTEITDLVIPEGVSVINNAFYGCTGLTSVTIPESVTSIGGGAFYNCTGLERVNITDLEAWCNISFGTQDANPLTKAHYLYLNGERIDDLVIPNSVEAILSHAFSCGWFSSVTIPSTTFFSGSGQFRGAHIGEMTLTNLSVGNYTFYYSTINHLFVSPTVTYVENLSFYGATIDELEIPYSEKAITWESGKDSYGMFESATIGTAIVDRYIKQSFGSNKRSAFYSTNISKLTIGSHAIYSSDVLCKRCRITDLFFDGITEISSNAFYSSNTSNTISNIHLPYGLSSIGSEAFRSCGVNSVIIQNETPIGIDGNTFGTRTNETLFVPEGCKAAYAAADYWKDFKNIVEVPATEEIIDFADANVKSICVAKWDQNGDGELSNREAAFLTDISGFYGHNEIVSFNEFRYFIGTTYCDRFFMNLSNLQSITIPKSVTSVHNQEFKGCSNLTSITVDEGNTVFDSRNNCNAIIHTSTNTLVKGCKGTVIPDDVTEIGFGAFYASGLTSIVIPNSVITIGNTPFEDCSALASIVVEGENGKYDSRNDCNAIIETATNTLIVGCKNTIIPNTVTSIGKNAFHQCSGITSINIPNTVTSIGDYAFYGCTGITSINIPNSVTSIGYDAFGDCSGLTSCTIGSGVTSFGSYAFSNCTNLTSVTVNREVPVSIGNYDNVFPNRANATLYVPSGCRAAYAAANHWKDFGTIVEITMASIVTPPTPKELTYTGSAQELVNPGEASGGTMQYSLDGMNYSPDIPTGTDVGEYTVYYKVVGDAGHTDTEPATVSVVIVPTNDWFNIVFNSDMEGTNNACFFSRENYFENEDVVPATIVEGAGVNGSRGIVIQSVDNPSESWATQFFIRLPQTIPAGTKYRMSFVCKASQTSSCSTEAHQEPNDFISWGTFGTVNFASDWQHFERTGVISEEQSPADKPMRTIAFNLTGTTTATTYYFDNIVFEIDLQSYKFPITFADTKVKAICVENWDTDEDGELSRAEAVVVTSLGDVFKGNTEITSFDELQYFTGLTSIGASAFQNCTGLTSVTIPNSVTSIGNRAFEACNSLTSVTIPNSVTNIGGNPFPKCSGLTSIIVEEGNANYDSRDNCNAIIETATNKLISGCKNTIIPEGITTIGGWSFSFCSELASINIPNGVTRIEMAAFENCYALSSVTIPSSVTIIEGYAFSYCCNLPSVTIPNSVTNIGEMAFNNCHNFTSIAIPNSVTSIGGSAFFNCNNLTTVIVDIDSPLTIDENTFSNRSNATLYVPAGTTAAYEAADYWKEFGSIVEISLQLTKYHKWDGCSATATVTEEDGGVEINLGTPLQSGNLLYGRNDVIYLYYADLTDYESLTIKGTPGLQLRMILNRQEPVEGGDVNGGSYIELLSTIDDNGKGVFSFADYPYVHLNAIKLHADSPSGTITCLTLNKGTGIITFADTKVEALCVQHWDTDGDGKLSRAEAAAVTSLSDVFTDNKEITSFDELRYFTGLTELHQWGTVDGCSFNGCTALKSITIPANVTMLYGASFGSCTSLEQISVHPANTKYESPAGCNAIIEKATNRLVVGCETTQIPDGITTIGYGAFAGRWGMQRMDIPGTVTTIEDGGFAYCISLSTITLPTSISAIGDIAFSNCNALTSVRCYMETPPTITEDVFTNRTNATLYVPEGSKAAYEAADYWKEFGSIVEMVISPQLTMYHKWDGCSATASVTEEDGRGEINLGTPLQGYNLLYGRNDVIYLYYADLTGYESLTIEGTPGMKLRVLLNRQEPVEGGDPNGGAFIEQNPTIGDDGKVTVSFSDYEFVHLNAIKLHVDSPSGIITSLTLTEKGQEEPVDPNNMLYAEEKTGRSGASVIIPVMLKTEQFYAGANFSVTLPEGFTLTKVKEEDLLTDHNITFQKTGEKTWTIFVYSTQRSQFSAKEGALLKLKVGVDNDIETGTYAMRLSNIVVSDLNLSENNLANSNSQIIINNSFGKLGDATNDGRRNVTDIMAVINYIFKIPVNNFNEIAADVNGDGDVNVTDIMGIVNLAFEEAAQNAQNSRALRYDYKTIEPE